MYADLIDIFYISADVSIMSGRFIIPRVATTEI